VERGIPQVAKQNGQTFTLHDSGKARQHKGLRDSVRNLIALTGYQLEEKDKAKPVNKVAVRRENQSLLKSLLTERFKNVLRSEVPICPGKR
jgi:uncharacterized protein YabE (DUF348 family)